MTAWFDDRTGPRVLVAFASRHGATREIAAELARWLPRSEAGRCTRMSTVLAPVQRAPAPDAFDAVVLGSAVYAGQWLEPAVRFACEAADDLRGRPTWLFSSGLTSEAPTMPLEVDDARRLGRSIGALGSRVFPGRLERRLLSAAERQVRATGTGVAGDFRDWGAVRAWSEEIAADLVHRPAFASVG